jgi:hypothetical protein
MTGDPAGVQTTAPSPVCTAFTVSVSERWATNSLSVAAGPLQLYDWRMILRLPAAPGLDPSGLRRAFCPGQAEAGIFAEGSTTVNVLPLPSWLSTVTVPFMRSITCFTIESPSPVPPTWRDRALSTR